VNIGFYNFYKVYNQNRMFLDASSTVGQNLAAPFVELAKTLRQRGHQISTIDTAPLSSYDAVVFLDYPTRLNSLFRQLLYLPHVPRYLILNENASIRPDNYDKRNHTPFRKVLTWNDDLVDGRKYWKCYLPVEFGVVPGSENRTREKFCVLISNNKFSNHSADLYAERRAALDWFAEHAPESMELYGEGWDRWFVPGLGFFFNAGLAAIYRRAPWLPRHESYPFWRGSTRQKRQILANSKFSICYENAIFPGYITEKIFDCLFAGCVPVYMGAPNVTEYIPANAFIDRRKFTSEAELFCYLKGMSEAEYLGYRKAIDDFLRSPEIRRFSSEAFSKLILEHVVGEIEK